MAETFWESGAAVDAQPEANGQEVQAEPGSLAVSADDFSGLENRVLKAIELVKRERGERAALEARATQAETQLTQAEQRATQAEMQAAQTETQLREQSALLERMQLEMSALKTERDQVRQRVERLLQQLDGLEL